MDASPLSQLADIDWAQLTHANGPADDVPKWLRDLVSPDPGARGRARRELREALARGGVRYEASAYAVPFLLHLAADPETPERPRLLRLLAALAVGDDAAYLPGTVPVAAWRREAAAEVPGLDDAALRWKAWSLRSDGVRGQTPPPVSPAQQRAMRLAWLLAAYDAAEQGVGVFRRLLRDPSPGVRAGAAHLLAFFPEHADGSLPLLLLHARMEPEPVTAAAMLVAAGLLGTRRNPVAGGFVTEALAAGEPWLRWAAAVVVARRDGVDADPRAVEVLAWWVRSPVLPEPAEGDAGTGGVGMPFLGGDARGLAARVLTGAASPGVAVEAMVEVLPRVWGAEAAHLVGALVRAAFPRPVRGVAPECRDGRGGGAGRVRQEELTGLQRRVVGALAAARNVWFLGSSPLPETGEALAGVGLPGTFEGMRRFARAV